MKSKKIWLIVDAYNLCYRAFHSIPKLSHEGELTHVVFGVLRDVMALQDLHLADNVIFAFDSRSSNREAMYPKYKAHRKLPKISESFEEREKRQQLEHELYRQIDGLRLRHLPYIGYRNVLHADGFEADDIIASICWRLSDRDEAIVVSSDSDLYQLLRTNVMIWQPTPKTMITTASFIEKYRILPRQWSIVKAIAGCSTDNIPGIKGIGEKTALKYIRGELPNGAKLRTIKDNLAKAMQVYLPLTSIPLLGTPLFDIQDDDVSPRRWRELTTKLGMHSIADRAMRQ